MSNYIYATLLSSVDYITPVILLNKSIRKYCSFPLLVLITNNISEQCIPILKKQNIKYKIINFIEYSKDFQNENKNSYLLNIASKFGVFTLTEYDKVVYLDADAILFESLDELFNYKDGSLIDDGSGNEQGFCGMFVCCPKYHPLDFYIHLVQNLNVMECDVIEKLWKPFYQNPDYRIPHYYFYNITTENMETYCKDNHIHALHFCYKYKPWNYETLQDYFNAFAELNKPFSGQRYLMVEAYFTDYLIPFREELRYD